MVGYYFLTGLFLPCVFGALEPGNWRACLEPQTPAPERVNTMDQVANLRTEMVKATVQAYIVPSSDFHLSEFVSQYDKRRKYISGFSGSAGTAVITMHSKALWTDGRYYLQAESQLGCGWILMRQGEKDVPSIAEWLATELLGQDRNVGACHLFIGNEQWLELDKEMERYSLRLRPFQNDLIDKIWTQGRPPMPSTPINAYPVKYAGKSWQDKIIEVQEMMAKEKADYLIITSMDETAWLFNARANDVSGEIFDPVFYSAAIIEQGNTNPILYIHESFPKLTAEPTDPATNITLARHINTGDDGKCVVSSRHCIRVLEFDHQAMLRRISLRTRRPEITRVWVSPYCNYGIYATIPQSKLLVKHTPVAMLKATKNPVEVEGMKLAHIKDAVALARFMVVLEHEVRSGGDNWTKVTELEASKYLSMYRSMQENSRGDSFTSISSFGPHAAINHYMPTPTSDLNITTESTYLLDSGGQYLEGTTDITRTFLFRTPTDFEKECYTRVLMGQIDTTQAFIKKGKYGRDIDVIARMPLWEVGLNYRHGTGHGIGHYLSVHEGPTRIASRYSPTDVPLEENMFFSNEPGFYKDGEFGIRLENIMYVSPRNTKYTMPGVEMFGFKTVTLFPYEPHMIDRNLLEEDHLDWLRWYNQYTLDKLGPVLLEQGDMAAYRWVEKRTTHPVFKYVYTGGARAKCVSMTTFVVTLVSAMLAVIL